jgi:hypothetical protein
VLYWFRTPPGVKVGRAALDEDAIRLIEDSNPEIEFDWTRILKGQSAPEQRDEQPPRGAQGAQRQRRPGSQRERTAEPPPRRHAPAPTAVSSAQADVPGEELEIGAPEAAGPVPAERRESLEPADLDAALAGGDPAFADLGEADGAFEPAAVPGSPPPPTAAHGRLGPEGVLRLRARHAEVLARISERVADAARRDELKAQAERLNPDTWVTDDEVRAGLEQYEAVFESLRTIVGRRRKRRRRRPERLAAEPSEQGGPVEAQQDDGDSAPVDDPDEL